MQEEEKKKPSAKLLINSKMYSKILYLCGKVSGVEWSGVIFFKVLEGNMYAPESGLKLEAVDLHLMAIDSPSETEFEYDGDELMKLYEKNPEYMEGDIRMGSIHSHHTMGTFFSGTDMTELKKGSDTGDFYLMLIVNNTVQDWTAKVGFSYEVENIWKKTMIFKNNQSIIKEGDKTTTEHGNYDVEIVYPFSPDTEEAEALDARIVEVKPKRHIINGYRSGQAWTHYTAESASVGSTSVDSKFNAEYLIDIISSDSFVYVTPEAAVRSMAQSYKTNRNEYLKELSDRIDSAVFKEQLTAVEIAMLFNRLRIVLRKVNSKWAKEILKALHPVELAASKTVVDGAY